MSQKIWYIKLKLFKVHFQFSMLEMWPVFHKSSKIEQAYEVFLHKVFLHI